MQTESGREKLARFVSEKREKLQRESESLPTDFSPETYSRWEAIRTELQGLAKLRTDFLQVPRTPDPEEIEMMELLY